MVEPDQYWDGHGRDHLVRVKSEGRSIIMFTKISNVHSSLVVGPGHGTLPESWTNSSTVLGLGLTIIWLSVPILATETLCWLDPGLAVIPCCHWGTLVRKPRGDGGLQEYAESWAHVPYYDLEILLGKVTTFCKIQLPLACVLVLECMGTCILSSVNMS